MHQLTHKFRDTFFEILHEYKKHTLNIELLTTKVDDCLQVGLDALCDIMHDFTGEDVSACIKLIEYTDDIEDIDIENATVCVFTRSSNSDSRRKTYDNSPERSLMYLKDDTALMRIVGKTQDQQDHFYQGDLDKFAKACEEAQDEYKCPTRHREKFYNGTIVLQIRVLFNKLYHFKKNDAYHIIGFLCVDSLSKNAFRPEQEIDNCNVSNAFADEFYVILSKYRHYLNKLKNQKFSSATKPISPSPESLQQI